MQNENKQGLVLRKTSLRILNDVELDQVGGGRAPREYEPADVSSGCPLTTMTDQCPVGCN